MKALTISSCVVIWCLLLGDVISQLRFNAFNIQIFGQAKMEDPAVVQSLVEIINQYDLVLIQEIRDASEVAIYQLLAECNEAANDPWSIVMSDRLGRTSSTEQYAYFYRGSKMRVADAYQWDADRKDDVFERPPFVVRFNALEAGVGDFGFISIHAKPDDAVAENDALVDVYDGMVALWDLEDFIIGGDFNAACDYVGDDDWDDIRLRTDDRFTWIIGDDVNTRTRTDYICAYDRLVLAGANMNRMYVSGSAGAYRFDEDQGLTEEEALDVSDHVPVHMEVN